jgi:hypothetical protein
VSRSAEPADTTPGRPTLAQLTENIRDELWLVHKGADRRVEAIVLWEPGRHDDRIPPGTVLLVVGYHDNAPLFGELVARAADAEAAGIIAKSTTMDADMFRELGRQHSVTAVLARDSCDVLQLASLLKSTAALSATDTVAGARLGDLFTFANAVATMAGGAASIVDPTGRVLGFSNLADQVIDDQRRAVTLLMGEIDSPAADPDYRRVYASSQPVHVAGVPGQLDRVAAAVRSDDEILGTIWIVTPTDSTVERATRVLPTLVDAAALHLHHSRADLDLRRTRRAQLLTSLLRGSADLPTGAALSLPLATEHWSVLAVVVPQSRDVTSVPSERLVRRLSTWLNIIHPSALFAEVDAQLVLLFNGTSPQDWTKIERSLEDFFQGRGPNAPAMAAIVGTRLTDPTAIRTEHAQIQTLAALLRRRVAAPPPGSHVIHLEHHRHQVDIAHMASAWPTADPGQPDVLQKIRKSDQQSGTDYLATLRAYVTANRNVPATASALGVHPNTARYRLEKIETTFSLDLADLDTFTWLVIRCRYLRHMEE